MSCLAACFASLTCGVCSSVASGISKKSARIAYCGLFGLSLILAWILREAGGPLIEKFSWINTSHHPEAWYQMQAVLRVSLGNFFFFGILALLMIGVKDQNDTRDSWQHGGWIAKMVIWLILVLLMFFMPNPVISVYSTLSKFGAGLFLLVQVLLLLDFVHSWNDAWVAKDEQKWYIALLVISIVCYLAAFVLSGIMFIWFNPSGHDCGLNVFFIVMTMILALTFGIIALHPAISGSLLPASVIAVYCSYVLYTALTSEPHGYVCNGLHNKSDAVSTSTLVLGMLTTILSVLYSALRAGSSSTFLSPGSPKSAGSKPLLEGETNDVEEGKDNKDKDPRPVSYSYSFFHLIFALASMYAGMLLSGWTDYNESSTLIDVGWTSVWIRICSGWVTAALYIWTLVAPLLLPDREFL
ncbi:hypothetical protein ACFE04_005122 [Oxalis oulophora]